MGIFFSIESSLLSQDSWEMQSSGISTAIYGIDFVDPLNGWFAGEAGIIFHSENGGLDWNGQESGVDNDLNALTFINQQEGWVCGTGGVILKTVDGGNEWEKLNPETGDEIADILFVDSLHGWAIVLSSPVSVIRTTDGGETWTSVYLSTGFPGLSLFALNTTQVMMCGGFFDWSGYIAVSNDGGQSWQNQVSISSEPIFDIYFFDEQNGFAVGGDIDFGPTAWSTQNGGQSWERLSAPLVLQPLMALTFVNNDTAWTCGAGGRLYRYSRSEKKWTGYESGTGYHLYDIDFVDDRNGWICGGNGFISKYVPEPNLIFRGNGSVQEKFILKQNYPNPFNPATTIEYILQSASNVRLEVYNNSGQKVCTLLDQNKLAGTHRISWNGADDNGKPAVSGIYYYRLSVTAGGSGSSSTGKMILLK